MAIVYSILLLVVVLLLLMALSLVLFRPFSWMLERVNNAFINRLNETEDAELSKVMGLLGKIRLMVEAVVGLIGYIVCLSALKSALGFMSVALTSVLRIDAQPEYPIILMGVSHVFSAGLAFLAACFVHKRVVIEQRSEGR